MGVDLAGFGNNVAQLTIDISTDPLDVHMHDPSGDNARTAFDKVNDNFTELFAYFMTTLDVNLASLIAGERNASSATTSYLSVKDEWNYTSVNLATDSTIVNAGPTLLGAIYVDVVLSAHACPIADGGTTVFSLIASLAAGSVVEWCRGTRFLESLVIDPDNDGTGTIIVQWRPLQ